MKQFKSNRKKLKGALSGGMALQLGAVGAYAEDPALIGIDESVMGQFRWLLAGVMVMVFLVIVIIWMLSVKDPSKITLMNFLDSITGKNAEDPEMDHEYDGIQELDNPVPAYLRLILWGSVAFAFLYMGYYHVLKMGPLSDEEYRIEMATAELKYKAVELPEDQLVQITDRTRLERGKEIFLATCAACHREDLGGITGPNLTDPYWLHGGDIVSIYNTISNGVPGKTMIGWKQQISSQERLELASYILSLQGSNPKDAKEPEGVVAGEEPAEQAVDEGTAEEGATVEGDSLSVATEATEEDSAQQ